MMPTNASNQTIPITFEGRVLAARRGESLLAALTASGEMRLSGGEDATGRGAYCGMGVCHDCLVVVDGAAQERACLLAVNRPMWVNRLPDRRPMPDGAAPRPPRSIDETPFRTPDLLIIGAGPAGLAAAVVASRAGMEVLVLDERSAAGGQYFKQLGIDQAVPGPDRQHLAGTALIREAYAAGAAFELGTRVWGAFPGPEFAARNDGGVFRIRPQATIIATGAYESAWAIPGWTLPGVLTTGAAQTLWRQARRVPGKRVMIAGNGPLNLQLAAELVDGGAEIVGLIEAAPAPSLRGFGALIGMAAAGPALLRDGFGLLRKLKRRGVGPLYGTRIASIERFDTGLVATVVGAHQRQVEADIVCLGYGLRPSDELARMLGCRFERDSVIGQPHVVRSEAGETNVPGIYVAGDGARLGGAHVAMAEGKMAALEIVARHGLKVDDGVLREGRSALRSHRRFQCHLWRLYAPASPPLQPGLTDQSILCRCEGVRLRDVDDAIADGHRSAHAIKHRTRLGMGRCQGRYCGEALAALLPPGSDELHVLTARPPARPVTIGDLAR